ncbi:YkvA family protein [Methylotenera sp. L2L1]|uniref:YkvA family protein n=1 Tax=Methylotenera sp. L2L1 TaxID=1502770 RepID=UPI00055C3E27|nr:DUF1232 domain-containing protein [Methylotenera sp. L2L1]
MLNKLKSLAKQLKKELAVYRLVLKHPQTPWLAKCLLWLAVGYLLLPFDLIPDFIPILGQLDEVIIIPALLYCALLLIPKAVIQDCREQVQQADVSGNI